MDQILVTEGVYFLGEKGAFLFMSALIFSPSNPATTLHIRSVKIIFYFSFGFFLKFRTCRAPPARTRGGHPQWGGIIAAAYSNTCTL